MNLAYTEICFPIGTPLLAKLGVCFHLFTLLGDIHNEIHDFESGQIFSDETETVSVGNTAVVSQVVSPGRSSGRIRGEPDVITLSGGARDEPKDDSEGQDHSDFCQVTSVTDTVFALSQQGSNYVVDIPSECVVPGTETSTMVNKSLTQSENVQCKMVSNAKTVGRSCYRIGDEGQILRVKVADQYLLLLIDTGSQVSVLTPQVYEALPEKY